MDQISSVVFSLSALVVAPFWLLMLLGPRSRVTARVMASPAVVMGAVVLYAGLVLPKILALIPVLARPELSGIAALLGTPRGATIAWAHFLALDLFAGRWIFLDARQRGLSAWLVSPLLVLTLMFAPLGLGIYVAVQRWLSARAARTRTEMGADARVPKSELGAFISAVREGHRGLALLALGALGLLAVSLALQLVDGRQVMGAPTWMKPAKFAASIALTAPALSWILGQMRSDRRWRGLRRAGTLIAAVAALELFAITIQAARGVPSHFNATTGFDALVFSGMGAAITALWLAELFITVRAFRFSFVSAPRSWAIRLGLVGTLLGGAIGFVMPRPTPAQRQSLEARQATPMVGAHAVGVPDGGPGLPLTRWSTQGGDLRVPHFFGLHALQGLPLVAWLLERRRRRVRPAGGGTTPGDALGPIIAVGWGWIGLTAVTLWQALRGQPLIAPDGLTLSAVIAVALTAAGMGLWAQMPSLGPWRRAIFKGGAVAK
jgi:hypothetical protein